MTKIIELSMGTAKDAVKICKLLEKSEFPFTRFEHAILDTNMMEWIGDTLAVGYVCNASLAGRLIASMGFSYRRYPWNKLKASYYQEWICLLPNYNGHGIEEGMMAKVVLQADKHHMDLYTLFPLVDNVPKIRGFAAGDVLYKRIYGASHERDRDSAGATGRGEQAAAHDAPVPQRNGAALP